MSYIRLCVISVRLHFLWLWTQLCGWHACVCIYVCVLQVQGQPCGEWPISDWSLSWHKLDIPLAHCPQCVTQEVQSWYMGIPRRVDSWHSMIHSHTYRKYKYVDKIQLYRLINKTGKLGGDHAAKNKSKSITLCSKQSFLRPTAGSCRALRSRALNEWINLNHLVEKEAWVVAVSLETRGGENEAN